MFQDKVLVVEDEAIIAVAIEEALEDVGIASDAVSSCAVALSKMAATPGAYQAAVLDVGLPDGRGDALADALRAVRSDLPIVLCTAYGLGEIHCEAFEQGGIVVIGKPFEAPHLVEAVRAAVNGAKSVEPARLESVQPARLAKPEPRPSTLERAFALAESGQADSLVAIRRRLLAEGYSDGRSQLDGPSIQKQLGVLIRGARETPTETA